MLIWPDNDDPGRAYARHVHAILSQLTQPARVSEVMPTGLPDHGDIVDWIAGHGDAAEPDAMRDELLALGRPVCRGTHQSSEVAPSGTVRTEPLLVCLADVEQCEVKWLWHGRIPLGRISLLVGRPGLGKSFLTAYLAARVSTGGDWADGVPAPPGDTTFISAEDDPADTIKPRLAAGGADCRRVHLLRATCRDATTGKEFAVSFDLRNVDLIRQALDRLPGCKLVVVDPVGNYLGVRVDAHRDNEVRAVLTPLVDLAAERGVAVVLVCHRRKAHADAADDTVLGSRAFVAVSRCVLHLIADPNDRERRLLVPGKSNPGRPSWSLWRSHRRRPADGGHKISVLRLQVDNPSLENLSGTFDAIKKVVGEEKSKLIVYRQGDTGEVDIGDVLSYLSLFNLNEFPDRKKHPNKLFGQPKLVLDQFVNDQKDGGPRVFDRIIPRTHELLVLADRIRQAAMKTGKLGKLKVSNAKKAICCG